MINSCIISHYFSTVASEVPVYTLWCASIVVINIVYAVSVKVLSKYIIQSRLPVCEWKTANKVFIAIATSSRSRNFLDICYTAERCRINHGNNYGGFMVGRRSPANHISTFNFCLGIALSHRIFYLIWNNTIWSEILLCCTICVIISLNS